MTNNEQVCPETASKKSTYALRKHWRRDVKARRPLKYSRKGRCGTAIVFEAFWYWPYLLLGKTRQEWVSRRIVALPKAPC